MLLNRSEFYIKVPLDNFIWSWQYSLPVIDYLRNKGLRLTPQRLELIRVLEKQGKYHPSFSEICEAVWKKHKNVSQSTILKNLTTFEELGLIRAFSFRGETHYELNPEPHVNIIAKDGKIVDVEDDELTKILEKLVERVSKKAGVRVRSLLVIME